MDAPAIRPEMESISTPMNRAPGWPWLMKLPCRIRLQDRGVGWHAEAGDRLVYRGMTVGDV